MSKTSKTEILYRHSNRRHTRGSKMSESKKREKENEATFWVLAGVFVAFFVQVLYDLIGLFTSTIWKVVLGFVMIAIFGTLVLLLGKHLGK
jgi:hypothetical protein